MLLDLFVDDFHSIADSLLLLGVDTSLHIGQPAVHLRHLVAELDGECEQLLEFTTSGYRTNLTFCALCSQTRYCKKTGEVDVELNTRRRWHSSMRPIPVGKRKQRQAGIQ